MLKLIEVKSTKDLKYIKKLFSEYAKSLGFDLCFQSFDKELVELPGKYAPPYGCLILALHNRQVAGCVALRKISKGICEMKRLYVKPRFRGKGIGRNLARSIIEKAGKIGYTRMRLDTVPAMKEAISLYHSLGFKKTNPYRYNPIKGTTYMDLNLSELLVTTA